MLLITSTFENGRNALDFGYIENLNDGRGFTAGYIGFCTGTGDLLEVVESYTKKKPDNRLAKYLPALRNIVAGITEDAPNQSVSELDEDFSSNWIVESANVLMQRSQTEEGDRTYYIPAMKYADKFRMKLPLSRAVFYDTIVMQGNGTDPDSFGAILRRTLHKFNNRFPPQVSERVWISNFLRQRKRVLLNPYNAQTQVEWHANAERADIFQKFFDQENFNYLNGPLRFKNKFFVGRIP